MPTTQRSEPVRPTPVNAPSPQHAFPTEYHLVITTASQVHCWNSNGLGAIFTSGSRGILVAKEAKDGSGMLAIADSQVVVLHDLKRSKEHSYRLKGADGRVRLLEYAEDSKNLLFTTTLQNSVQSYSLRESRLLSPTHVHPSPPTVLAISPSSHLLLTASETPPTIYLQNLTLRTSPVLIKPRASTTSVTVASFHPERPDIFLLAFRDGSLGVYNATRVLRENARVAMKRAQVGTGYAGEIGYLKGLHSVLASAHGDCVDPDPEHTDGDTQSVISVGSKSTGITGAGFLPGYQAMLASVGADGKCRISDFETGAKIARTWHVKGAATSLSILSRKATTSNRSPRKDPIPRRRTTIKTDSPSSAVLAVGRSDGKVMLYDIAGNLLSEQTVDSEANPVLDVDWMKGSGPIDTGGKLNNPKRPRKSIPVDAPPLDSIVPRPASADPVDNLSSMDGSQEDLPSPRAVAESDVSPLEDPGTVRHVKMAGPVERDLPPVQGNYMDLFSPLKQSPKKPVIDDLTPQRRIRYRPRIRSSTFVDNTPELTPKIASGSSYQQKTPVPVQIDTSGPSLEPVEGSPSAAEIPAEDIRRLHGLLSVKPARLPSPERHHIKKLPLKPRSPKKRRVSNVRMPGTFMTSSSNLHTSSSAASSASTLKILADLKRVSREGSERSGRKSSALLAPYMEQHPRDRRKSRDSTQGGRGRGPNAQQAEPPTPSKPTADDVWLTSEDDSRPKPLHRRWTRKKSQPSHQPAGTTETEKPSRRGSRAWIVGPSSLSNTSSSDRSSLVYNTLNPSSSESDSDPTATFYSAQPSRRSTKDMHPGAADSFYGPMPVDQYFPRGSSLVTVPASQTPRPTPFDAPLSPGYETHIESKPAQHRVPKAPARDADAMDTLELHDVPCPGKEQSRRRQTERTATLATSASHKKSRNSITGPFSSKSSPTPRQPSFGSNPSVRFPPPDCKDCGKSCCPALKSELAAMLEEMWTMKAEIIELKAAMKRPSVEAERRQKAVADGVTRVEPRKEPVRIKAKTRLPSPKKGA